jgi:hypothetical protein
VACVEAMGYMILVLTCIWGPRVLSVKPDDGHELAETCGLILTEYTLFMHSSCVIDYPSSYIFYTRTTGMTFLKIG